MIARGSLSYVDIVVSLCWDEQLEEVQAGMPVVVYIGLEEDGTRGIF